MKQFIFLLLIIPIILCSETITLTFEFDNPSIKNGEEFQTIHFENTHQFGKIGEPQLPYFGTQALLPQGEIIENIVIEKRNQIALNRNVYLYPTQPQYPLSDTENHPFLPPAEEIYQQNSPYPANPLFHSTTQFLSGFSLGFFSFTPVEFYPEDHKVSYFQTVVVTITTKPDYTAQEATRFLHNDRQTVNYVSNLVENKSEMSRYHLPTVRREAVDFIIVALQSKVALMEQYAELYRDRGFTVHIEPLENIQATQSGSDLQMKIRNYFIQEYENNPLRFGLLVGDVDVIPHRGMYVDMGQNIDHDIPADMYYSSLDGTWDNNGNGYWGEPDEADLAPEFAIGRLPYNNDQEILNVINKAHFYLNSPASEEVTSSLFIGEYLWEGPTWGGDYMDEMIGGSSTNGHTTSGVPTDWDISTLYERDGDWGANQLYPLLSAGPNLINHLGHANVDYALKLYSYQVSNNNITNNGVNQNFSAVLFSQGCYAGSFDNRTTTGSYIDDCIAEKFTAIDNGTVSVIANSRYGWGMQGSTNGASQFFHREFIDAIFGQDIFTVGQAHDYSKIASIPFITQPVMYWCTYEMNVLGDPALEIWTDTPQEITASYPTEIVVGISELSITTNTPNAMVQIKLDGETIASGTTGDSGTNTIYFLEPLDEVATLSLHILKHNFYPYSGTIQLIPGDGPYVISQNPEFTETGDYIDGSIQPLDTISISLDFINIGTEMTTEPIEATLLCDSEFITIHSGSVLIDALDPEETISMEDAFEIEILPGISDQIMIPFQVQISSDDTWQSSFSFVVNNSNIKFKQYAMEVLSGGSLEPGDEAEIYLSFENNGHGISYQLETTMISFDPHASISGSQTIETILPDEEATIAEPYLLSLSADSPSERVIEFLIIAVDENGTYLEHNFSIYIGAIAHNFENGIGDWTTEAISNGFGNEWHLSEARNYSANGSYSMKCGGSGNSDYSNSLHSGLVTPPIPLSANSYLTFYHWMDAEIENSTQAWDGGVLEISQNGGAFQTIMPVGGYPYTVVDNQASPFPPGTPLFSGTHDWQQVEVDLSSFSGTIQIRFTFGSDGYVTQEGWYIDDVMLHNYTNADYVQAIPLEAMLSQNYPNPFNPETTIQFAIPTDEKVELSIFNIKGQVIKELVKEELPAGNHSIVWDGKNNQNKPTASGMYFYRLKSGSFVTTKKMILMK